VNSDMIEFRECAFDVADREDREMIRKVQERGEERLLKDFR